MQIVWIYLWQLQQRCPPLTPGALLQVHGWGPQRLEYCFPVSSNGLTSCLICSGGTERLDYFKRVVDAPTLRATGGAISFKGFTSGELWIALITFL